jgi:PAS domain S-box-containing protein
MRWSLLARTLGALALATVLILGAATGFIYVRDVDKARTAVIEELRSQCAVRSARERAIFDRITDQVRHAQRILSARLVDDQNFIAPPPLDGTGSRRHYFSKDQLSVGSFVSATFAHNASSLRAVSIAEQLLKELGPSWKEAVSSASIAVQGQWLVTSGPESESLIADLLPDDPILVDVSEPEPGVHWHPAIFEPASGVWSVAAEAVVEYDGGIIRIRHELFIDDLLRHAHIEGLVDAKTAVIDDAGHVLASSEEVDHSYVFSEIPAAKDSLIEGAHPNWWLGVSYLPGPNWRLLTLLPQSYVESRVRHAVAGLLRIGLLIILAQLMIVAVLFRRSIAQPLRDLREAAQRLTKGERGIVLAGGRSDEIGDLARAFMHMDQAITAGEKELRSKAEELHRRETFAKALVDSAADGVVVLEDLRIIEANPRALALYDLDSVEGRTFLELAPPTQESGRSSREIFADYIRECTQGPQHFSWLIQQSNGTLVEVEIGLTRLDFVGEERYLLAIRDVSQRRRMEERIRHAERMESVGQLAGGVAHDFNNVLTAIMGSAEILRDVPTNEERKQQLLTTILTASERAAGLTRTLLDFSRRGRAMSSPIDVHATIQETVALLERSIDRRIDIQMSLCAEQACIVGDSAMLQNAILNLGLNARDAMPDGGKLSIATRNTQLGSEDFPNYYGDLETGEYIEISVTDSGCGMEAAITARIFEPFFTTKPVGKGTGLGLAAVYRSVREHNGGIAVASTPGQGTEFKICLPVTRRQLEAVHAAPTEGKRIGSVLVVDDEAQVRFIAVAMLRDFGLQVFEAEDGAQAVEWFTRNDKMIDMVIIDMEMPGLRGADCLKALHAINPKLPAVLCSGFIRDDDESWRDQGFVASVAKPYRRDFLLRAVDIALESHRHA